MHLTAGNALVAVKCRAVNRSTKVRTPDFQLLELVRSTNWRIILKSNLT
jgi:hypothetical protein